MNSDILQKYLSFLQFFVILVFCYVDRVLWATEKSQQKCMFYDFSLNTRWINEGMVPIIQLITDRVRKWGIISHFSRK